MHSSGVEHSAEGARQDTSGTATAGYLLEREDELGAIRRHLDEAPTAPGALLLEGEPGIGKTVLWRAGIGYARERGLRVLVSSPAGSETRLSFAVLGDLFDGVADEVLPGLPPPQRNALEVALLIAAPGQVAPGERTIGAATLSALRALAAAGSVVIAIDDVQWIDGPSERALAFALRRLGASPVSVLLGWRIEQGHHHAAQALRDALDLRGVTTVPVASLSAGAVTQLVRERIAPTLPRSVAARVHGASGGNPFYAVELARALSRHAGPPDPNQPLPVPETLAGLVEARVGELPAEARMVLAVAAALPDATLEVVAAAGRALGLDDDGFGLGLDDALAAGVVELAGDRLRFTHPLLASGAYSRLGLQTRRKLHRQLAGIVSETEERARHVALGAEGPSVEASEVLHEAARVAASRGAIGTAAELADRAVRLTPEGLTVELWERQLDASGFELRNGDVGSAKARLEAAREALPPGTLRAAALLRLARVEEESPARSLELCLQAIAEAEGDPRRIAEAHQLAAEMSMLSGDVGGAVDQARRGVELAEGGGGAAILIECLGTLCHYETYTGEISPGLLERAVALEQTEARPSNNYSPREILGLRLMYADRIEEGRALLEQSYAAAVEIGDELDRGSLLIHLTQLECRAGRLERAAAHARECAGLFAHAGVFPAAARFPVAFASAHLGRVDEARSAGTEGARSAAESGSELFKLLNAWALGFLELSLGNVEAADEYLHDLPEACHRMGYRNPGVRPVYADAIEVRIATGDLECGDLIDELERQGRSLAYPWAIACAGRCRGLLLAARGDVEGAAEVLSTALGEHERCPQPLERGRTLLALGATKRRLKQRREARELLTEALELFDAVGAPLWSEKAAAELARIPGRGPAQPELSETERRVAELVAQGLPNKEVAARLFITVRTVETHLSKIYAKLGVRSRAELASRLR
jgi:DNA-binding CsgD family transcriptional regulator